MIFKITLTNYAYFHFALWLLRTSLNSSIHISKVRWIHLSYCLGFPPNSTNGHLGSTNTNPKIFKKKNHRLLRYVNLPELPILNQPQTEQKSYILFCITYPGLSIKNCLQRRNWVQVGLMKILVPENLGLSLTIKKIFEKTQ